MVRLLFTTAPGFVSWLIKEFSGSKVSHVGIQVGPNTIIAAEEEGVVEQTMGKFLRDKRRIVAIYEATELGEPHLFVDRVRARIGEPYAFDELPGFAWHCIGEWLGKRWKNFCHDPKKTVCSELVCALDDETGFVRELEDLDPEITTPQDLLVRLEKGGPTFMKVPG